MSNNRVSSHASLDRSFAHPVPVLPTNAVKWKVRSAWEVIIDQVVKSPDSWFKLERPYKNPGSAVASARKTAAEYHSEDVAAALEFATAEVGDKFIVYLRYSPIPELEDEQ